MSADTTEIATGHVITWRHLGWHCTCGAEGRFGTGASTGLQEHVDEVRTAEFWAAEAPAP